MKRGLATFLITVTFLCSSILAQPNARPAGGRVAEQFKQLDRNGDGKVTEGELGAELFKKLDLNGDGFVTLDEYKAYITGQTGGKTNQATESPLEWFNRMDRNQDGKLSKEEVPSPRFKECDTDGDGFVTLEEYTAFVNRAALKQLDRNGERLLLMGTWAVYPGSGEGA